jgi:hypothetical protein
MAKNWPTHRAQIDANYCDFKSFICLRLIPDFFAEAFQIFLGAAN